MRTALARRLRVALFATLSFGFAGAGWAHKSSDALLDVSATEGGISVHWEIALRDLDPVLALDADDDGLLRWREVRERFAQIDRFALGSIVFRGPDGACVPGAPRHALVRRGDSGYLRLSFEVNCDSRAGQIGIEYRLFESVDPTHRALLRVANPDGSGRLGVLAPGPAVHRIDRSPSQGTGFAQFVAQGAHHILIGIDHLAFLLALLVAAVTTARTAGHGVVRASTGLAMTVTLFTVAHSLTLSAAALGWLAPPSHAIEVAIAATVVLAGLHLWPSRRTLPQGATRALVFAFGLIHGFGFASALLEAGVMRDGALLALFGFNLGVELGQLLALSVAFPLVWIVSTSAAARPLLARGVAVAIVAAGAGWFVERTLGVDLAATLLAANAFR